MRYQFWRWFVHARRPWSAMGAIKNQGTLGTICDRTSESRPLVMADDISSLTTKELIDELKGRAEAYGFLRSALGSPGIELWFLREVWDYEGDGRWDNE